MGNITPFIDLTGNMSQDDINGQNLSTIADELNRLQTNQDSINNNLTIVGQGTLTSTGMDGGVSAQFSTSAAYTFMAFFKTSDNENLFYPVPTALYDISNTLVLSVQAYSSSSALTSNQASITFQYHSSSSKTFTFYYFLMQQPASITLS